MNRRTFLQALAALCLAPRFLEQLRERKPCPTCGKLDREVWLGFVECRSCHESWCARTPARWVMWSADSVSGRFEYSKMLQLSEKIWNETPKHLRYGNLT